ncbi:MAG: hypothetical protein A3F84_10370 [Candidatus Handelsmanbacteria bacterium RIFCSPLOWO2_12_FULL_64_10]|uniref:Helix-turn-helix type 11 domain-containing protein n=1 Tax=Handelsmanbacteria sp. (strain RIFCSPLOWO2_12_FULL_64_10) TaxID=1817868 RepID=A0A1F6CAI5_HANXR|nr:MAG: hypothetical protein A3F84_10370 [Candidatus Handelsmanbacteria bacterium RIFCSPLOWO2_12_FULL_64_10]
MKRRPSMPAHEKTRARLEARVLGLKGRGRAMTGKEIAADLGVSLRQVGRAVRALRMKGIPIVSSSAEPRGYWVPRTAGEVRALCAGIQRRIRALSRVRSRCLRSEWLSRAAGQRPLRRKA